MGTFVGLTKTRKHNKNPYEFESAEAYNKLLAKEEGESPLESTKDVEKIDETFGEFNAGNHACDVCGMYDCEDEEHKIKEEEANNWLEPQIADNRELVTENEVILDEDVNTGTIDLEAVTDLNEASIKQHNENDTPDTREETENEIRNAERTSWSPGHKPANKPYTGGDLDTTIEERLNGMRKGETRGETRATYRATGEQSEVGQEVREDGKTNVEKTIDMLPAATVEEELED